MSRKPRASAKTNPPPASGGAVVRVVLRAPHTHAGVDYAAGAVLDVTPAVAAWLRDNGIAESAAHA